MTNWQIENHVARAADALEKMAAVEVHRERYRQQGGFLGPTCGQLKCPVCGHEKAAER